VLPGFKDLQVNEAIQENWEKRVCAALTRKKDIPD
jgi:hypothetical protein